MPTAEDLRIRRLRAAKPVVDPWQPVGCNVETECRPSGEFDSSLTIFLAGRECPFTCVFCDLWQYTTDQPTPPGAIPAQIRQVLESPPAGFQPGGVIKLYNASNFFDAKAVPPQDDGEIIELTRGFRRVVVECHALLIGQRCFEFSAATQGRLEVAMGFETVHPEALRRLNKRVTPDDLARAAERLREAGIPLRAFVLIQPPFIEPSQQRSWLRRSVAFALEHGAETVSLIPLRGGGPGAMSELQAAGDFTAPRLRDVEDSLKDCWQMQPGAITVDPWDLEHLTADPTTAASRIERLQKISRTRQWQD